MLGLISFLCILAILGMVSYLVYKQNQSSSSDSVSMMGVSADNSCPASCTGGDCYGCVDWGGGDISCEQNKYGTMTKDECESCRKAGGCSQH